MNDRNMPPVESTEVLLGPILRRLFGKTPPARLLEVWAQKVDRGIPLKAFLQQIVMSKPFLENKNVRVHNPAGHYFSPVVDPDLVRDYYDMSSGLGPAEISGIDFHLDDMLSFWTRNRDFISTTPFHDHPDSAHRYAYLAGSYNHGDAITLRAMIGDRRPRRVIEIGSGLSSACILDSAEQAKLDPFHLTCIEPYPDRLKRILRPGDEAKVELFERGAQEMPLEMFRALEAGDILFIDSTHVLKTGSDVHYELFFILPVLKPGVLVHFHDCRFPFEYSETQVFAKNYSWNEAYAVRALLMYSARFRIVFHGSLFAREYRSLVEETCPTYLRNPGSALWIEVCADTNDENSPCKSP
jgi:predicted O-methyltransferase YrrM